ncbi:MAG: GntR family transcriptional regulator [Xanthomonadaceae bacterium]|nr:GntR family transcriptional regulator [Xanthomonadaceae bacterium]MDE1885946.1 GntR family transcriptional regulator [Xanthomonadaceae bacterium]MDE2085361.1 GntR family transcriptional regulator [Xanthomonadaceae bacterium]MDE2257348.1 GntR family transcriptional regulator [Xanthomonadaceae bacterium]
MASDLLSQFRRLDRQDGSRALNYMRLRQALLATLESGGLQPGQALPGERELAKQLVLSRVTVRKAIAGLVDDGILTQRQGAGTFVAERIIKSFSRLTGFTDDLRARGIKPRVRFLERNVGQVSPAEALALHLSPGARVVRLRRLRFAGATPLALEDTSVPQAVLRDPKLVKQSLYDALEKLGCRPVRALQRLRAVALDPAQAQLLQMPVGSPALAIERRAFLADGRVVELTSSIYRGDAYDFVAELHAETPP